MKQDTFEDYLRERHAAQYQGLDDDMGEDFDDWLADLDVETLLQYGDLFGEKKEGFCGDCLRPYLPKES